jgi:hypothetical protein
MLPDNSVAAEGIVGRNQMCSIWKKIISLSPVIAFVKRFWNDARAA